MKQGKTCWDFIGSVIPDSAERLLGIAANTVTVLGLTGGAIGIVGTLIGWVSGNGSQYESIKSCMLFILSLLIIIVVLINRKQKVEYRRLLEERKRASHRYAALMSQCKNKINEIEKQNKTGTANTLEELERETDLLTTTVTMFLHETVESLVATLQEMTGKKICACIKIFPEGYGEHQQISAKDAKVITLIRSHNTVRERKALDDIDGDGVSLTDNTDFAAIVDEGRTSSTPFFYQNNLKKYDEQLKSVGQGYKNSTPNWDKYYIGTIVFPIRIHSRNLWYLENPSIYYTLGFLCVDSNDETAFPEKQEDADEYLDIMAMYADAVFNILAKYQYYLKQLAKKEKKLKNGSTF